MGSMGSRQGEIKVMMPSRNEITYCTFRRTFFLLYQGFPPGSPPRCCPCLLVARAGQGDERVLARDRVLPLHRAAHGVDAGAGGLRSVTDQNTLLDAQCQSRVFCRGGVRGDNAAMSARKTDIADDPTAAVFALEFVCLRKRVRSKPAFTYKNNHVNALLSCPFCRNMLK